MLLVNYGDCTAIKFNIPFGLVHFSLLIAHQSIAESNIFETKVSQQILAFISFKMSVGMECSSYTFHDCIQIQRFGIHQLHSNRNLLIILYISIHFSCIFFAIFIRYVLYLVQLCQFSKSRSHYCRISK